MNRTNLRIWSALATLLATSAACEVPLEDRRDSQSHLEMNAEDNTIRPILLQPADQALSETEIDRVRTAIDEAKSWYKTQLGGSDLRFSKLQHRVGTVPSATYGTSTKANATAIFADATSGLESGRDRLDLVIVVGLADWSLAEGNGKKGRVGLAVDGLANAKSCTGKSWCTPDSFKGRLIRLLGAGLTLKPSEPPSIMAEATAPSDYKKAVLLDAEKKKINALPFVLNAPKPETPPTNDPPTTTKPGPTETLACTTNGRQACGAPGKDPNVVFTCRSGKWQAGTDCTKQNGCVASASAGTAGCRGADVPPQQMKPSCGDVAKVFNDQRRADGLEDVFGLCEQSNSASQETREACGGQGKVTRDCDHCCYIVGAGVTAPF